MLALRPLSWLATLALLSPSVEQQGIELRWKLAAGDVLRYRYTMEQSMEMSSMPQMGMENSMAFVLREEVKSIGAGESAAVEVTYEAIRMQLTVGGEEQSFDSTLTGDAAAANDPEIAKIMQPLLGAKLAMQLEPNGRISDFSGMKEMIEGLMKEIGADSAGKMIEQMFSEESMRKLMELNVFPESAKAPGETWKRDIEQPFPFGSLRTGIESTLESLEEHRGTHCAKIRLAGKMSLVVDTSVEMPFTMRIDDSSLSGTMWFDTDHGRMLDSTQALMMKMSMGPASDEESEESDSPPLMEMTTRVDTGTLLLAKGAPPFEDAKAPTPGEK